MTHLQRRQTAADGELTGSEGIAVASLLSLLLIFAISLVYPSGAYVIHGAVGMCGIALLLVLSLWNVARNPRPLPVSVVALAAWIILWVVAGLRAPSFAHAREQLMTACAGVGAYLVAMCGMIHARRHEGEAPYSIQPASLLTGALVGAIGLCALFGVYQVAGSADLPRTFAAMERDILATMADSDPMRDALLHAVREGRAAGTLGAPNIFASLCLFALPLAIGGAVVRNRMPVRIGSAVAALVLLAAIVASKSSGGVLSAAGGVAVFLLIVLGWRLSQGGFTRAALGFALVGGAVFAALVAVVLLQPQQGVRWFALGSLRQRFYYWQTAWEIWRPHFLLGAGPGSFELLYPQFRIAGSNETKHAHSWFFEYGASVGAVGIGVFLVLIGHAMKSVQGLLKGHRANRDFKGYVCIAALAAGALAMLAHGLIEYTFFFRETAILFFLALGALEGLAARGVDGAAPVHASMARRLAFGISAAVVVIGVVPLEVTPMRADLRREAAAAAMSNGAMDEALSEADAAIGIDDRDERNWELRAHLREQQGDPKAVDDWQRAILRNPHSARLRESLARFHFRRGDFERAIELQKEAIRLHPLDANHQFTLAEFHLQAGDAVSARDVFEGTKKLLLPTNEEVKRGRELARRLQDE
ncbi:O-antigen ligase family protein [Candidatus Sumerlaeota bacterium]|nr:O-antigen ligase family protein [Candidatus Sumerlaeota bacterium]